jgi:hypothetical protein
VDAYHNSDMTLLDTRTMLIVGIFGAGYLKVGGRAPKVTACGSEHNKDYTITTVDFTVSIHRAEFEPSETLPLMEQFNLKEATT